MPYTATMNAVLNLDPQMMRPLVHEKVDRLSDEELAEVHKQLVLLEARRELDRIGAEIKEEWDSGRITQEKIDETIRHYRATHPYRTPGRP